MLSLYLPAFILAAGVGIATPALPLYAKSFHVDFGTASMVVVMNQLGGMLGTLPTGFLIDRVGRRKIILIGPFLTGIASILMATAQTYPELLLYRFIEGWAMQMWMIARLAVVTDRGGSRRGTQITGMFGMDSAGRLLGPAIGGFLAAAFGLRAPFVVYGFMAFASIIPSFFLVRETMDRAAVARRQSGRLGFDWAGIAAMFALPLMMVLGAQFLASATRGSLFGGTLDLYAVYAYGIGPATVGLLAAAGGALGLPLTFMSGRIMDRFGRQVTTVPGFSILAVALVGMAMTAFLHLQFEMYVGAFLFSRVALSVVSGNMQVIGSDLAPPSARGTFFGLWGFIRNVGQVVSPGGFALVADHFGFGSSFLMLSVMSLGVAILLGLGLKAAQASAEAAELAAAETVPAVGIAP
jgi:DHA1 family multidrug resistance protein-like MFS transporter